MELPVILTGPAGSADYFKRIDEFLVYTLGESVRDLYRIIIDDPVEVARVMRKGIDNVGEYRRARQDAFYFNWRLTVLETSRNPSTPITRPWRPWPCIDSSRCMSWPQPATGLFRHRRRQRQGTRHSSHRAHGPFRLSAEPQLMARLDDLLTSFVAQGRMKLAGEYVPCYTRVKSEE